jgi:hypothetical protein
MMKEIPNDTEAHPDYPGLTRADVREAQKKALLKAEKARKEAAMARVELEETKRLQMEEGITAGGPGSEFVEIDLQMPIVAYGKHDTDAWIQIDGKRFRRGRHTVRRSQAHDLLYIASRMAMNESARLGEDRFAFYQQVRQTVINNVGARVTGVINAPVGA